MHDLPKRLSPLLAVAVLAVSSLLPAAPDDQPAKEAKSDTTTSPAPPTPLRNPFQLTAPTGNHGLVPATGRQLPHGIRLLGIAVHEDGTAFAVLRLPGPEKSTVFVEKDDVIRLDENGNSATRLPGKGRKATPEKHKAPLYLLVQNVSSKGVEVSPQQSPSEVHLIR